MEVTLAPKLLNFGPGGIDDTPRTAVVTTTYTASVGEYVAANATGGTFTVTLPSAAVVGVVTVAVTAGQKVTVARAGSDTIDGAATSVVLATGQIVSFYSNGATAWRTTVRAGGIGGPSPVLVSTVAASGAAQTIGEPTVAAMVDITLTANCTLTLPTTATAGKRLTFVVRQDGTGSRTLAWPAGTKFLGGAAPVITTAAGSVDIITAISVVDDTWLVWREAADVK